MPNPTARSLFLPLILFLICNFVFPQIRLVSGSSVPDKRFQRPDPLRRFKHYNGGFDVRDKHYLASAAFTGVHGYAIAGVWLLCGLLFGIFMIIKWLCGGSASLPFKDCLDNHHILLFLLILLLTSLAIVASSLVFVTNQKALKRTEKLKDSVLGIGEDALRSLTTVIKKMKQMQYLLLPYNQQITGNLNTTIESFRSDSRVIRRFLDSSGRIFQKAIHTSYIAHLVVVAVNLAMLIAALVLLLLFWRPGFITIIFCCWMLTSLCWVLTGFDFFLHTFAEEACFAFEEFEQNPQNSSLSSMLPCMNDSDAAKLMTRIGFTIHTFIAELNAKMSEIYGVLGIDKQAQKVIGIVKICEPFSGPPDYNFIPKTCPRNAIPVGDLPKILARFKCGKDESAEDCEKEAKFLPEAWYNIAHAYSRSVQDFLDIYPDLQSLSRCSFLKDRTSDILLHQCRPLKLALRFLWASMLSLSIVMIILVLAWLARAFLCSNNSSPSIFYRARTRTPESG
ncbi:uncharacterized protein LOC114729936 [Neltuma alba]|uniref:uncharacterized protein LOC114729936 n=1 Tax=Neltuma alba TaxID=207710 RepID=UPI0010A36096|nr:uncharacterized protein LOC114729936 [Prosopis alba]